VTGEFLSTSKSTAVLFLYTSRDVHKPRKVQVFGEPVEWVDTVQNLGAMLDTQLIWSTHSSQVGKKAAQRLCLLGRPTNSRRDLSIRNGGGLYK
jgi:hypothetical protein